MSYRPPLHWSLVPVAWPAAFTSTRMARAAKSSAPAVSLAFEAAADPISNDDRVDDHGVVACPSPGGRAPPDAGGDADAPSPRHARRPDRVRWLGEMALDPRCVPSFLVPIAPLILCAGQDVALTRRVAPTTSPAHQAPRAVGRSTTLADVFVDAVHRCARAGGALLARAFSSRAASASHTCGTRANQASVGFDSASRARRALARRRTRGVRAAHRDAFPRAEAY